MRIHGIRGNKFHLPGISPPFFCSPSLDAFVFSSETRRPSRFTIRSLLHKPAAVDFTIKFDVLESLNRCSSARLESVSRSFLDQRSSKPLVLIRGKSGWRTENDETRARPSTARRIDRANWTNHRCRCLRLNR